MLCNHSFSDWFWGFRPFSKESCSISPSFLSEAVILSDLLIQRGVPHISTGWPCVAPLVFAVEMLAFLSVWVTLSEKIWLLLLLGQQQGLTEK